MNTAANYTLPGALTGWNMITMTVTSSGYSYYLDGSLVSSGGYNQVGTPLLMSSGETLSIGSQTADQGPYGAGGFLSGALQQTGIYNGALSAAQVASLYASGLGELPSGTTLSVAAGATFDMGGVSQEAAALTGSGTVTNSSTGTIATLTLDPSSGTSVFSGTITNGSGTASLALNGAGNAVQVLSGVNTFTGTANVLDGTLLLSNSAALAGATLGGAAPWRCRLRSLGRLACLYPRQPGRVAQHRPHRQRRQYHRPLGRRQQPKFHLPRFAQQRRHRERVH